MSRKKNIEDLGVYRRSSFNPIFDLITDEFDNSFKEKSLNIDTVIKNYYTEARQEGRISDRDIMTLFARGENSVNASDDFTTHGSADESIYLLLGKKGMGKSTLLYSFYSRAIMGQIDGLRSSDLLIYLDLRDLREDKAFKENIRASLMELIFYWIYKHSRPHAKHLTEPVHARKISALYKYFSDQEVCRRILDHKEEALFFLFNWLKSQGKKVFLIVDNLDDFDRESIITIFDLCHRLKTEYSVKSCLALRDYWNPKTLKIDDKTICTIKLPPPNVYEIIKKRIYSIDYKKLSHGIEFTYNGIDIELTVKDVLDIFNSIVEELSSIQYQGIYDKLHRLTNYNTREFLVNIYHYFHSPYLFATPNFTSALAAKITERDPDYKLDAPRELRLHDFIQGFMAVHALCYDFADSTIFNVFHHEYTYVGGYNYKNVFIFVRLLQILQVTEEDMEKKYVVDQLVAVGYPEPAVLDAIDRMLKEALVESIDGIEVGVVETIKLSAKGRLYLNEMIGEYTYLLFIADGVPMEDQFKIGIKKKFGSELIIFQRGNLGFKHDSVRFFIEFVHKNELEEDNACPKTCKEVLSRIKGGLELHRMLFERAENAIRLMRGLSRKHKHYGITRYKIIQ